MLRSYPVLLIAAVLSTSACLEREEVIVVRPDGTASVVHTITGQGADLDGGAARYPAGPIYQTHRTVKDAGTDDEKTVYTARAELASLADLPDSYAPADTPDPEAYLRFPTDLRLEEREDGRHYFFVRRYVPREWARFAFHERRAFPPEIKEIMDGGPLEELDRGSRLKIFAALAEFERGKHGECALEAIRTVVDDEIEQLAAFAAARSAIGEFLSRNARPEQLDELMSQSEAEILRRSEELQERLDRAIATAIITATSAPESARASLERALARVRRAFEVTQDLDDENFIIQVTLPGRIVAHNADEITGGAAVWRFDGKDLHDREQVLSLHTVLAK